jgi:hypothetical protein
MKRKKLEYIFRYKYFIFNYLIYLISLYIIFTIIEKIATIFMLNLVTFRKKSFM